MIIRLSVVLRRTVCAKVTTKSPSQDYTHPDDHNLRTYSISDKAPPAIRDLIT